MCLSVQNSISAAPETMMMNSLLMTNLLLYRSIENYTILVTIELQIMFNVVMRNIAMMV